VDPRAGLDDVEKRKFLTPLGLELRHLSRYTDYAIPAPGLIMQELKIALLGSSTEFSRRDEYPVVLRPLIASP
jgi:hypothetical protein